MSFGGSKKGGLTAEINVTPLVDVVLVLLIIFMVLTPVIQMGYLVRVPPKAPANLPPSAVQDQIVLRLAPGDRVLINKDEMTLNDFPARIRDILRGNTSKMVFFSGSRDVDYETTIKFLDLARASGAKNIGIIVEDPTATPAAAALGTNP
ncbi:MAG TPA: biopolymer transporter ExbD [Thermoanaerobaculia bacterium]|nr:biopolymer transporter ExbD [Thermoanaerobaculia bacterium]